MNSVSSCGHIETVQVAVDRKSNVGRRRPRSFQARPDRLAADLGRAFPRAPEHLVDRLLARETGLEVEVR